MDPETFVPLLLNKLQQTETDHSSLSCRWDDAARVMTLTYSRAGDPPRDVLLSLPRDAVAQYADGSLDQDVRDVWGDGVGSVEGAARFATVHLDELVQTNPDSPLLLELTPSGIRRQRSVRDG